MTFYTILPLEWSDIPGGRHLLHVGGGYILKQLTDEGDVTHYMVRIDGIWNKCNSLDHGKQLCQKHWESEAGIGKYLQLVRSEDEDCQKSDKS